MSDATYDPTRAVHSPSLTVVLPGYSNILVQQSPHVHKLGYGCMKNDAGRLCSNRDAAEASYAVVRESAVQLQRRAQELHGYAAELACQVGQHGGNI